jgi:phosphoglycerate kinase
MINIRTIDQLHFTPGARVFYRVDYNVPLDGSKISDDTRINETLRTIQMMRERGAAIVLASHLGRPKGKRNEEFSLKPCRERLAELTNLDVQWADDCVGDDAEKKAEALQPGQLLLLENLRFHAGEEKNDSTFAGQLRRLADFYVNDAFGASHRAHASIEALPRIFPRENTAGGLLLAKEIQFLQKVTQVSDRPFVALLGGAKIAGKIEPLEALVKLADVVLIGGGMANTFLAASGKEMGGSLVDRDSIDVAKRILSGSHKAQVVLPTDLVVADDLDNPKKVEVTTFTEPLRADQKAFDIGPQTIERYAAEVGKAKTIFWNGPMGVFEKEQFAKGTKAMAKAVGDAAAIAVVGGGESVEAVKESGYAEKISHVSTGGGASLEFISGTSLPGVEVLRNEER